MQEGAGVGGRDCVSFIWGRGMWGCLGGPGHVPEPGSGRCRCGVGAGSTPVTAQVPSADANPSRRVSGWPSQ